MQRYIIDQFDKNTFVIIDQNEQREVCVCSNYDDWDDAEERAKRIAKLLNGSNEKTLG
jgi:hypothetical protein